MSAVDSARALLPALERERDRIMSESRALGFLAGGALGALNPGTATIDPFHFRDVAASNLELLEQIDRFVGEVFARVERAAVGPPQDLDAGDRLLRATQNILAAISGVSPMVDVQNNARDTARDALSQLQDTSKALVAAVFGVFVLWSIGKILRWW